VHSCTIVYLFNLLPKVCEDRGHIWWKKVRHQIMGYLLSVFLVIHLLMLFLWIAWFNRMTHVKQRTTWNCISVVRLVALFSLPFMTCKIRIAYRWRHIPKPTPRFQCPIRDFCRWFLDINRPSPAVYKTQCPEKRPEMISGFRWRQYCKRPPPFGKKPSTSPRSFVDVNDLPLTFTIRPRLLNPLRV
jgi:hypothetical protein